VAALHRISLFCLRLFRSSPSRVAWTLYNKIIPPTPALAASIQAATQNRIGLEIGGPSSIFTPGGILPVYSGAARIDNVNFSSNSSWEAGLRDGGEFNFSPLKPPGRQFLCEASTLHAIADASYDFLLSSHCLEHVANPLGALCEWRRVIRPGGHLIIILPDPSRTFDHRRPVTEMAHLQADFSSKKGEDDLSHLDEILRLHDLRRDYQAGTRAAFRARSLLNAKNRCLHHHVFNLALIRNALAATGWRLLGDERVRPLHLIALGQRSYE
jgi:SAM-dependent methyltransferase